MQIHLLSILCCRRIEYKSPITIIFPFINVVDFSFATASTATWYERYEHMILKREDQSDYVKP